MISYKMFAGTENEVERIQLAAMRIGYTWAPVLPYKPRTGKPGFIYLLPDGKIEIGYNVTKYIESKALYIHSNSFLQIIKEMA